MARKQTLATNSSSRWRPACLLANKIRFTELARESSKRTQIKNERFGFELIKINHSRRLSTFPDPLGIVLKCIFGNFDTKLSETIEQSMKINWQFIASIPYCIRNRRSQRSLAFQSAVTINFNWIASRAAQNCAFIQPLVGQYLLNQQTVAVTSFDMWIVTTCSVLKNWSIAAVVCNVHAQFA